MITSFLTGNFGNNLAGIISSKCIAKDLGFEWGVDPRPKFDYHNRMIQTYFLNIDYGKFPENIQHEYYEKEIRYNHNGDNVDIRVFDKDVYEIKDNTVLMGGCWQSFRYFENYLGDIKQWVKIKDQYIHEYDRRLIETGIGLDENTCVINFRGGEYSYHSNVIIRPQYYQHAMSIIKKHNPNVKFIIVTDDVECANRFIPGIPAYHFDIGMDYYIINNAYYVILSNSSFPIFAGILNEKAQKILAPKYWGRHNVSIGYWSVGDEYYPQFEYVDRDGILQSYVSVKLEAELWRKDNGYLI